jgi:hypothetical protein
MYWRQVELLLLSLALKLGYHPCTKAVLVAVYLLDYALYMYRRQVELLLLSLASKLGCHLSSMHY